MSELTGAIESRVSRLEKHMQDQLTEKAVWEVRMRESEKLLNARFDRIAEDIRRSDAKMTAGFERIDGLVGRIAWLIFSSLILGVVAFIISGGISVVS